MFSLPFKKVTYRFELVVSEKIQSQRIQSPANLINYVIGVNNALIQREESGWMIIKKYKQTKNSEQLLMAQKIDLPIYEDNPYFDELLTPFYTKKPLAFESVDELEEKEEVMRTNQSVSEMPEEMKELLEQNQNIVENETEEKVFRETKGTKYKESLVEESKEEIEKLRAQLLQKEQEVQCLKQENKRIQEEKQVVPIEEQLTSFDEQVVPIPIEEPQGSTEPVVSSVSFDVPQMAFISSKMTTQSVSELLATLCQEMRGKLDILLQEERYVMEEEIRQLDKRSEIRPTIQRQMEQERTQAFQVEEQRLAVEKQALCQVEQERHKKRMAEIEAEIEAEKQQCFAEIKQRLEEKEIQLIEQSYAQQTEELDRTLQERKEAFFLRQQEVNEGLNQQLTQILASFNTKHNEIIAQLETQKQRSAPVILEKQIS
ncbi:TPA: hypothetical protein I0H43_RS03145 [Enterococcus faecalis]|nr:hypothetical protein [Enterococcus faecalis]